MQSWDRQKDQSIVFDSWHLGSDIYFRREWYICYIKNAAVKPELAASPKEVPMPTKGGRWR
jgi:hypothetical protein